MDARDPPCHLAGRQEHRTSHWLCWGTGLPSSGFPAMLVVRSDPGCSWTLAQLPPVLPECQGRGVCWGEPLAVARELAHGAHRPTEQQAAARAQREQELAAEAFQELDDDADGM